MYSLGSVHCGFPGMTVPRRVYVARSVRHQFRCFGMAHRAAGLDRVRLDARRPMAVPFRAYQAALELRRRHEFRDGPYVLHLLGALSAVETARGRVGGPVLF